MSAFLRAVGVILVTTGCGGLGPAGIGESCSSDSDCALGLCALTLCVDPARDDDGDGLSNALEMLWRGNPFSADSDLDGIPDDVEFGSPGPVDTDGDGKPDFVESRYFDRDGDCIPDQFDSDDDTPETNMDVVRDLACPVQGVCTDQRHKITASCSAGTLTCEYASVIGFDPITEQTCDGIDSDCDGKIDEDFTVGGVAVGGLCAIAPGCGLGEVVCAPGGLSAVCSLGAGGSSGPGFSEICDGIDNDCDGLTDEGQQWEGLGVGSPCSAGGACALVPGVVECHPISNEAVCSTAPGGTQAVAQDEICDGADNDCDGLTDEGMVWMQQGEALNKGEPCGLGACSGGVVVCGAQGAATCSTLSFATAERCDGTDNDCDGVTDGGLTWFGLPLGAPCAGLGECGLGTVECAAGLPMPVCSTMAGGSASAVEPERCDGLDNDCNGLVDDGLLLAGAPVGGACMGACGGGAVECGPAEKLICSSDSGGSEYAPLPERCDGLDTDCNGVVDDGLSWAPGPPLPLLVAGEFALAEQGIAIWPRRLPAVVPDASGAALYLVGGHSANAPGPGVDAWRLDDGEEGPAWSLVAPTWPAPGREMLAPVAVSCSSDALWHFNATVQRVHPWAVLSAANGQWEVMPWKESTILWEPSGPETANAWPSAAACGGEDWVWVAAEGHLGTLDLIVDVEGVSAAPGPDLPPDTAEPLALLVEPGTRWMLARMVDGLTSVVWRYSESEGWIAAATGPPELGGPPYSLLAREFAAPLVAAGGQIWSVDSDSPTIVGPLLATAGAEARGVARLLGVGLVSVGPADGAMPWDSPVLIHTEICREP